MLHIVPASAAQPALQSCCSSQPQDMAQAGSEGPLLGSLNMLNICGFNQEMLKIMVWLQPCPSLARRPVMQVCSQARALQVTIQNIFLQSPIYLFACKKEHGCLLLILHFTHQTTNRWDLLHNSCYFYSIICSPQPKHLRILGPKSLLNKPTN